jgi:hypothetical protein
MGTIAP